MKKIIFPFSEKNPRIGEGDAIVLNDGRVYIVYSLFTGWDDHDASELVGAYLDVETGALSEEKVLFTGSNYINQMSVSLERFNDGSIGITFGRKLSRNHDLALFARSFDECRTWTRPRIISHVTSADYFVVNNCRMRQLRSGRIVIPVCIYPEGFAVVPSYLELWYSDDMGETWNRSAEVGKCADPPKPESCVSDEFFELKSGSGYREQEPGVEECADGTLYYYCRTNMGYMYQAWSKDHGETFTDLSAQTDLYSPLAPQTIRRQPGTSRLWCVYNNSSVAYGDVENHWGWRTPLALSYSDDNGKSWKLYEQIEDDSHNYCYTSVTFVGTKLLLTYYESENLPDGTRRNLASLKMQTIELP